MQEARVIDFDWLGERLAALSELAPSVSEAHGMLCGLLCARVPEAERTWVDEVLAGADTRDLAAAELRSTLGRLGADTRGEIEGPGLGFAPLLPPEDRTLRERATGLYDWSRGFLYGLGLAEVDGRDLPDQVREVIDDFADITRLDLEGLDEDEDNEEALVELQEFVWVAAMLIYEERGRAVQAP